MPKNPVMRAKWLSIIGKEFKANYRVCSDHFAASDFSIKPGGLKYLKKEACPVIAGSSSSLPCPQSYIKPEVGQEIGKPPELRRR